MRGVFFLFTLVLSVNLLQAQTKCYSFEYMEREISHDPSIRKRITGIESFTEQTATREYSNLRSGVVTQIIRVPVVFHVLYNSANENISIDRIMMQLNALNRDFRRKNSDTVKTPQAFRSLAADMEIEFYLARQDPSGRSTSGIERKYSPVKYWTSDDKMKFSSTAGLNAWDTKSYLNIWICNIQGEMGYSTLPGADPAKDGIVLSHQVVSSSTGIQSLVGRTLVHEAGHWLNLRHIWGDTYCGDDFVNDTPKQSTFTVGCHTDIRRTCGNTEAGDMYMNYMDFTDDGCMNLFTKDQKKRARSLFESGGYRQSILSSKAFDEPVTFAADLPDFYPAWSEVKLFPNPAVNTISINLEYDNRWIGKEIHVLDMTGKIVMKKIITSAIQQININSLPSGVYFVNGQKDGERIRAKFLKQ